jgi:hypothetical protein
MWYVVLNLSSQKAIFTHFGPIQWKKWEKRGTEGEKYLLAHVWKKIINFLWIGAHLANFWLFHIFRAFFQPKITHIYSSSKQDPNNTYLAYCTYQETFLQMLKQISDSHSLKKLTLNLLWGPALRASIEKCAHFTPQNWTY